MPLYTMKDDRKISVEISALKAVDYQVNYHNPCDFTCECEKEEDDICRSLKVLCEDPEDGAVNISVDNISIVTYKDSKPSPYSPNTIERQCIQEAMHLFNLYSVDLYAPIIEQSYYGEEYFGSKLLSSRCITINNMSFEKLVARIIDIENDDDKIRYLEDLKKDRCAMLSL